MRTQLTSTLLTISLICLGSPATQECKNTQFTIVRELHNSQTLEP